MSHYNPESASANVKLSFAMIKDFVNALPREELTVDLLEKKQRADAALEHLDSFFNLNPGEDSTDDPDQCGPKPTIPTPY